MTNLTPEEYFNIQFGDTGWELIRSVRIDSPNSKWSSETQAIFWIVKIDKKTVRLISLYTNNYETDGETYKKYSNGLYLK